MQYSFFIILLYIMVVGLVAAVALCIQVGYSVGGRGGSDGLLTAG